MNERGELTFIGGEDDLCSGKHISRPEQNCRCFHQAERN
jgi:hypothetical protein